MKESFIILFVLFPTIFAECCLNSYTIVFDVKNTTSRQSCSEFRGASNDWLTSITLPEGISMRCHLKVCADGKRKVGTYCGVGSCNMFGCNCEGGCLTGDPVKKFYWKFKDDIRKPSITRYA
nr:venom peptide [Acharia stimulea]